MSKYLPINKKCNLILKTKLHFSTKTTKYISKTCKTQLNHLPDISQFLNVNAPSLWLSMCFLNDSQKVSACRCDCCYINTLLFKAAVWSVCGVTWGRAASRSLTHVSPQRGIRVCLCAHVCSPPAFMHMCWRGSRVCLGLGMHWPERF